VQLIDFTAQSIALNAIIFVCGSVVVWLAGTKLSAYVDLFADRSGLGEAFAGVLLLGVATSLPEIATTITAATSGAGELAGTNLLGGVVMQIAVLALVDACFLRGKPLTLFSPRSSILMSAAALIFLLSFASAAVSSGEAYVFFGIGLWPIALVLGYLVALKAIHRNEGEPSWEPRGEIQQPPQSARDLKDAHQAKYAAHGKWKLFRYFVFSSLFVLVGGYLVAKSGEAIADQTGLGEGLVGAVLVAFATSLPEVSTTWSAVRFGAYSMAIANILGTNGLEVALLLPADIAFREGSIIETLGPSAVFLTALGTLATTIYMWGILERRDKTVFGMGRDSFAVLIVYLGGMVLYYSVLDPA
jgi:cation:H+ antiporter